MRKKSTLQLFGIGHVISFVYESPDVILAGCSEPVCGTFSTLWVRKVNALDFDAGAGGYHLA